MLRQYPQCSRLVGMVGKGPEVDFKTRTELHQSRELGLGRYIPSRP